LSSEVRDVQFPHHALVSIFIWLYLNPPSVYIFSPYCLSMSPVSLLLLVISFTLLQISNCFMNRGMVPQSGIMEFGLRVSALLPSPRLFENLDIVSY